MWSLAHCTGEAPKPGKCCFQGKTHAARPCANVNDVGANLVFAQPILLPRPSSLELGDLARLEHHKSYVTRFDRMRFWIIVTTKTSTNNANAIALA